MEASSSCVRQCQIKGKKPDGKRKSHANHLPGQDLSQPFRRTLTRLSLISLCLFPRRKTQVLYFPLSFSAERDVVTRREIHNSPLRTSLSLPAENHHSFRRKSRFLPQKNNGGKNCVKICKPWKDLWKKKTLKLQTIYN